MRVSRREFLTLGLVGGAMLALPFGASACASVGDAPIGNLLRSKTLLPESFLTPLLVPPVLQPARSDAKADYYEITQKAGSMVIFKSRGDVAVEEPAPSAS